MRGLPCVSTNSASSVSTITGRNANANTPRHSIGNDERLVAARRRCVSGVSEGWTQPYRTHGRSLCQRLWRKAKPNSITVKAIKTEHASPPLN